MPPLVSYCVLSFNRKTHLQNLLSQLNHTRVPNSEIVVVDNGSTDGTRQLVTEYSNSHTKFILNPENTGVSRGWNTLFQVSEGKLVFILNDDYSIVQPGWEQLYLQTMEMRPGVMSFPRTSGPLGAEVYTNWIVEPRGKYTHNFRLFGIPRDLFNRVGKFNEDLFYSYEDTDFNMRAVKLGFPLLEMTTAAVHLQHLKDVVVPGTPKDKYELMKEEIHRSKYNQNTEIFYKLWPRGV